MTLKNILEILLQILAAALVLWVCIFVSFASVLEDICFRDLHGKSHKMTWYFKSTCNK